ncbi:MAG TPA: hypothetical protein DCR97_14950 [Deltaproteobacteria bacterium]|nr:hypothetical protein [Deltaproteobacteria bacterium]
MKGFLKGFTRKTDSASGWEFYTWNNRKRTVVVMATVWARSMASPPFKKGKHEINQDIARPTGTIR